LYLELCTLYFAFLTPSLQTKVNLLKDQRPKNKRLKTVKPESKIEI
jgi:hypothetical protein